LASEYERLHPGHPGRGFDPTPAFSDYQWYFFHQRSIAYFGAFSTAAYDLPALVGIARGLIAAAPHYNDGYRKAGAVPSDATLARICSIEAVTGFDGFPDRWLDDGAAALGDPDLPLFRIRVAQRNAGPDAEGRRSFILVQVAHALTEGSDSARLSRSHSAARAGVARPQAPAPWHIALPARLTALVFALLQLSLSRLFTPHPGTVRLVSRAVPRQLLQAIARDLGVGQRALFMALVAHTMVNAGRPQGKGKVSCAYTTLAPGGGEHRDRFMRMRMLYTRFRNAADFRGFARGVEETVTADETAGSSFVDERSATALGFHRRLARIAPFLYAPKFFAFWPHDFVFSLLTPHQLAGELSTGLLEPVYCGTTMPGVVGCIVVPGRDWVTFNFFIEEEKLAQVGRLDAMIGELSADAAFTRP
jgi:hypothetical protein